MVGMGPAGRSDRLRFEARPLAPPTARPGRGRWAVVRIQPSGHEECLAYGDEAVCVALAAHLQDREDDRHRPAG